MLTNRPKQEQVLYVARRMGILGLVGISTVFAMVILLAGSRVRSTEASSANLRLDQPVKIAPAADPSCRPLAAVTSTTGANGAATYQSIPIIGDASALYTQCGGTICGDLTMGAGNSCMTYCAYNTLPIYGYALSCPGPAAAIFFAPSPTTATCGGASNLELVVLDGNGLRVLNGVSVSFTTTLGYVSSSDGTQTGLAYTSLTIPPKQAGQALITATSGGATAQKLVTVTC